MSYNPAAGSIQHASLFTISNNSGSVSTGALGFTPKLVLYVGAVDNGSSYAISQGFATGVGALQRGNGFGYNQGSGSPQDPGGTAAADNGSIAGLTQAVQNTAQLIGAFNRQLQVTAFGPAGITFTWSLAVSAHQANVLVLG